MNGVAISGKAGSGKSTLAQHVVTQLRNRGILASRIAFGDALKREVKELYGVEKSDPLGRTLLVGHGEARRDADPLYWIRQLEERIDAIGYDFVVIDDLRFPTELAWCIGHGFLTVRLEASEVERRERIAALGGDVRIVGSASFTETGLDACQADFDIVIQNEGDVDLADRALGIASFFRAAA